MWKTLMQILMSCSMNMDLGWLQKQEMIMML